jgi:hypothetical protein
MAVGGKRKSIRLGKVSRQTGEKIKVKVEYLVAAVASACPLDLETATWVSKIGDDLAGKLAAVGLIARRVPAGPLAEFLDSYIAGRTDHKPSTAKTIAQARRLLVAHFGADKPLNKITAADAENWRNTLRARYKPATVGTHIKRAKQMFQHAVDGEILDRNPFAKLKAPKQVDKSREVFIAQETILRVIEAAPDTEWRLIIALCRFGGLRCPSEVLRLEWGRIDWERDRFTVFPRSSNTFLVAECVSCRSFRSYAPTWPKRSSWPNWARSMLLPAIAMSGRISGRSFSESSAALGLNRGSGCFTISGQAGKRS